MSSLFASMQVAANALDAFDQAIATVQSNVTNSSTAGYVTQRVGFSSTYTGGVIANQPQDSRSYYAERSVWNQSQQLGAATRESASLAGIQSQFDVSGTSGIPGALSGLYSAFSAWSTSPADTTARTEVLTAASNLATAFNAAYSKLQEMGQQTTDELRSTATQINDLTSQIAELNGEIRNGAKDNPGFQAKLYDSLQQLSTLTSITVHMETDGTATVLMNGQVPLVVGQSQTTLSVAYPSSPSAAIPGGSPSAQVMTSNGQDVTSFSSGGEFGGLLNVRNSILPGLLGDQQQQGSLNQLAQGIADRINTILQSGQVTAGPPAISGSPLFTYDSTNPSSTAPSLSVNTTLTASDLAAIQPGPPVVANGIATHLASLQNPTTSADMLNGLSYTDAYSAIAAQVGTQASNAASAKETQTDLLNQAENMRSDISGVSLDEQAAQLQQYEQAYQAASKVVTIVNEMMGYLMDMIQ